MTKDNQDFAAKRMARLASVQGLYQIALTSCTPAEVFAHFRENPTAFLHEQPEDIAPSTVDYELFKAIIAGVIADKDSIDSMITGAFTSKSAGERVEALLRAILRAGVYELHHNPSVPTGIIINDYVDVTHTFFDSKEPSLVNGILDKLSKTLRAA